MEATARPASSTPLVDIVVQSARWRSEPEAEMTVRRAIAEAAVATSIRGAAELAIVLTDDTAIRALNRAWRGLDEPTNVLSFPAGKVSARDAPAPLGDIVIAYETTAHEAATEGRPFAHHLAHLAVHGFLHLLGYDHESDDDADAMEDLERTILARLDVPDPYTARHTELDADRHA